MRETEYVCGFNYEPTPVLLTHACSFFRLGVALCSLALGVVVYIHRECVCAFLQFLAHSFFFFY